MIKVYSFRANNGRFAPFTLKALEEAMVQEKDDHIVENMVGDVSWSMKTFISERTRFTDNGGIMIAVEGDTLAGIAGCEINNLAFDNALQFGIRLWIHPEYRKLRGLKTDLMRSQLRAAQESNVIAWACFNEDRTALTRMIDMKAKDPKLDIAKVWEGFKVLPEQKVINHTLQTVAYKEF